MIDTEALRKKVIDLAIQGKLTQQLPEDGNAEDLYAQIQKEKAKLIKEGKIKKEKPLPEISDDEILFEIPSNWKWMRIADVVMNSLGGGTPSKNIPEYWNNGDIPWVSVKDFSSAESGYLCDTIDHITQDGLDNSASNLIDEDAIVICMRMALGKIVRLSRPMAINQDLRAIWLYECINESYFVYFYSALKIVGRGTTVSGIKKEELMNFLIPLPPLSEQKRIVEKLNDVLAQIDIIDALQQQYESDREILKGKIIDAGIQGKLTEQLPDDGTGEELYQQIITAKKELEKEGKIKKSKKLPDVSLDEIPFDIPRSWRWVKLGDICSKIVDGDHNPPKGIKQKTEYLMASAININHDRIENLDNVRYLSKDVFDEENKRTNLQINDVLLTIVGTMGRSCVYEGGLNLCFQRSVSVITTLVNSRYIKRVLDASYIQKFMQDNATGAAQLGFYLNKVEKLIIPLPPIQEQQRIVDAIDSMLIQMNG